MRFNDWTNHASGELLALKDLATFEPYPARFLPSGSLVEISTMTWAQWTEEQEKIAAESEATRFYVESMWNEGCECTCRCACHDTD